MAQDSENTGLMAKAIAEGAKSAGLDVILKKVDEVSRAMLKTQMP